MNQANIRLTCYQVTRAGTLNVIGFEDCREFKKNLPLDIRVEPSENDPWIDKNAYYFRTLIIYHECDDNINLINENQIIYLKKLSANFPHNATLTK